MKISVIVNPAAGSGRVGRQWPQIGEALRRAAGNFDVSFADAPGQASRLAERAVERGAGLVAVVGGDGTVNEVVNGLAAGYPAKPIKSELAIISLGSGNDFSRTLDIGPGLKRSLKAIGSGRVVKVDLGLMTFTDESGQPQKRWFLNVANIGMSGEVVQAMERSRLRRMFGTKLAYPPVILGVLRTYGGRQVSVSAPGQTRHDLNIQSIAVCNGRYFGSGMLVAPDAMASDGLFDVIVFSQNPRIAMTDMRLIYSGRHLAHPAVSTFRATRLDFSAPNSGPPVLCEADGELLGRLPCTIELVPGALSVRV